MTLNLPFKVMRKRIEHGHWNAKASESPKMLQKFYNHHFTCTAMPDEYGTLSK